MPKSFKSTIPVVLFSFLVGCGSGSDKASSANDNASKEQSNSGDNNGNSVDSPGGGATSNFTAKLGVAIDGNSDRIEDMRKMAKIIYAENDNISGTLNFDYKHGNSVGYYVKNENDGLIHTGIDIQSDEKENAVKIGSLVNGEVVGIVDSFGAVIVQTLIGETPYHISFLHLDNIQVNVGDEVKQGQILGDESDTSLYDTSQHLHIEVFTPCMETIQNEVLDVDPRAVTWKYAIDPISIVDDLTEKGSHKVSHKTYFIDVGFANNDDFEPGVNNTLKGCVFNSGGFEDNITFQILDEDNEVLSTESYNLKKANNLFSSDTVADLTDYKFGTEAEFMEGGTASKLSITLQQRNALKTTYELDVKALPSSEDHSTKIELGLAGSYYYFSDSVSINGCIEDPDGIESITLKLYDANNKTWLEPYTRGIGQEDTLDSLASCSEEKDNSISLNSVKYKSPYNLPMGDYSLYMEVVDTKGIVTDSQSHSFKVINSVAKVEHVDGNAKSGASNKFVIKRIENDENYHQIVNLPQSCLRFDINGNVKIIYGNFEQAEDLGIYRQYFTTYYSAKEVPKGLHNFEFYSQCEKTHPKVTLASGTFMFE
ncbi:M23 family metallopeptidase [Pseudoalteromonas piscicida]|uniref:M23ase beta-sheet core domain-containing protein n=1 Tax=Pseudoalteromonas piscicida TaxID=43662 RepID=A0A2A5JSQ3_PSEO7|nr:M23 family metallopeptidase [Pseudoalteromonas piscicida]PCK32493.1 hypothetical protein CEX98_07130 [Pseudoalteromonas piscicida]